MQNVVLRINFYHKYDCRHIRVRGKSRTVEIHRRRDLIEIYGEILNFNTELALAAMDVDECDENYVPEVTLFIDGTKFEGGEVAWDEDERIGFTFWGEGLFDFLDLEKFEKFIKK